MKIAMVFPYAPSYRAAIYQLMDSRMDIDWFFAEKCQPSLKLLDYSSLKKVNLSLQEIRIGPFSTLKGCNPKRFKSYDAIIIPGVFRCLSDILLMLKHKQGSKPKLLLWTHGWYGKESKIEKWIKHLCYKNLDGIFVYGDRAKNLMIDDGFDGDKIFPIHNSLNYETQLSLRNSLITSDNNIFKDYFKNEYPTIIFIGRLTSVKRLDMILDSLEILKKGNEYFNLVFVGDGSELDKLKKKVAELNLSNQVWFYGACFDEASNASLIYNADLCVSPGNVGLTSIHSMMFGCPVISNDDFNHQMPEFEVIKPNVTGAFFNAYETKDLARTISDWFKSNQNRREIIRGECFRVIDEEWNPTFQYNVLTEALEKTLK